MPQSAKLEFSLRRRDPKTGETITSTESIDPRHTLIVVIDVWEYHWCNTWCGLAGGRVPRLDRAMQVARDLGFTIVHAPTDSTAIYSGMPQRERMAALPRMQMPARRALDLPPFPKGQDGTHCMCHGVGKCVANYGQLALDPRMTIAPNDLISGDGVEVYTWCLKHGITHVIVAGFATNMCMTGKPEGLAALTAAGLRCAFTRDQTEAYGSNTGAASADRFTEQCVEHLEKFVGPSIDLVAEFRKRGLRLDQWQVDPVRIVPWGTPDRPVYFERDAEVTMTFPLRPEAEIHYTLDGAPPTASSSRYLQPIRITDTTSVIAAAFEQDRSIGLQSECRYVRLPKTPPLPDIHLSDLTPAKMTSLGWIEVWSGPIHGSALPPQKDLSYSGTPLTLRETVYGKGMGVHAPTQLTYAIQREYARFVARVGMDEAILKKDLGREVASFPCAVFKVFIDGQWVAESPRMRLGQEPWSFDLPIPPGSKVISLTVTDANGQREDHANWVNAGFVLHPQ